MDNRMERVIDILRTQYPTTSFTGEQLACVLEDLLSEDGLVNRLRRQPVGSKRGRALHKLRAGVPVHLSGLSMGVNP